MADLYLLMERWDVPETEHRAIGPFTERFDAEAFALTLDQADGQWSYSALAWVTGLDNLVGLNQDDVPTFEQFKAALVSKAQERLLNTESYLNNLKAQNDSRIASAIAANEKGLTLARERLVLAQNFSIPTAPPAS